MFFPERIQSIGPNDTVLEIGPGGASYHRADVLLEKRFDHPSVAEAQRAFTPPLETTKEVVYYDGGRFPFDDKQFEYVICSHVLEHVEHVDAFVEEIVRVAKRGYVEYPTIYYDYVYNIPEHISLIFHRNNFLYWMPKAEAELDRFRYVQDFFLASMRKGYTAMVDELRSFLIQGFEWEGDIVTQRAYSPEQVSYTADELQILTPAKKESQRKVEGGFLETIGKWTYRMRRRFLLR